MAQTTADRLANMPVTEPFDGSESSLERFNTDWSALGWASGTAKGSNTTTGWRPVNAFSTVNGASYNPTVSDTGSGVAVVATMAVNPGIADRYFSLWLDLQSPSGARAGYELRFTYVSTNTYNVKLSKWQGGTETVLASKSSYAFANGNSLALVDQGGTVSAWAETGSGFTQLLSASDATFSGGNAGVEGAGNITRLTDFKAGSLSNTADQLANMAVTEPFDGSSESVANFNTDWSALGWASGTAKGSNTTTGWRPVNAFSTVNGASYTPTVTDTGSGVAVVATMAVNPGIAERYFSLWLDLQSPSGARAGYELRFTYVSTNTYNVKLSKWQGGTETVLASKSSYAFANGNSLALVDQGGTVSAWAETGSGFTQLLSASDATFSGGNAGVEGAGNITRLTDFKAGSLDPQIPDTTITSGPNGTVLPDVSFAFTSTEPGSSFECSLDGAPYSACTSPEEYQGLAEGSHTFHVRAEGASGTPDPTPAERSFQVIEVANALPKVPLLDDLERQEVPLATGKWSKSSWAGEIGGAWAGSYHGYGSSGSQVAAAYWNQSTFSDAGEMVVAAATIGTTAHPSGQRLGLWLNTPNPGGIHSGYEARFEGTDGSNNNYKVELSKWVSGTRTVLASTSGFTLAVGTTMVLSDSGDRLTLWTGTSNFTPVLSANDSTYSSGYAGLEVKGGAGTEYDFRAGNMDLLPPDTSIVSGPSGKIVVPDVSFAFTSTEPGSSFECSLDEGAYVACESPKEYEELAEGEYTFRVRATDPASNVDPTPAERSFEVADPPETTITTPMHSYTSGVPTVEFISDEPGSTFKCILHDEGAEIKPCESPYALPEKLSAGWHTFEVFAIDEGGNADPTPAKWTFNPSIYPKSSLAASKLSWPEEGSTTSHHFTLKAQWPADTEDKGAITGATFQLKLSSWDAFKTIPAQYVMDSEENQVSWPIPLPENGGETAPVFFDARAYSEAQESPGQQDIQLRAVFDGDPEASGASDPVSVTLSTFAGAESDATEELGPVSVNLNTGSYTIKRTDVSIPVPGYDSNLEFTRVYNSAYAMSEKSAGESNHNGVFGPGWEASAPIEGEYEEEAWQKLVVQHRDAVPAKYNLECLQEWEEWEHEFPKDECLEEYEIPEANWVEVLVNEGVGIAFDKVGSTYIAPEDAKEYKLSKSSGNFVLVDSNGTRTTFTQNPKATSEYNPSVVSFKGTPKDARMVYEVKANRRRLKIIIAPSATGVECDETAGEHYAPSTVGCRSLTFSYHEKFPAPCDSSVNKSRLDSITYYDATGSGEGHPMVQYVYDQAQGYDEGCVLSGVADLRTSPNLVEEYGHDWSVPPWPMLTEVVPPGEKPWELDYYPAEQGNPAYEARLKSVSRASLLESEPTAQTTVVYDVPMDGEDAPYDLSADSVAEWGQSDYPVAATAIFPPDQVPEDESPDDYSRASVNYMDPDGYLVNTASAAPPGVEGDAIVTSETDEHGNVVRALNAGNRLLALEAGAESVAHSHELDSKSIYSADGTELLEELGPLHEVQLENGEAVEARSVTQTTYDENAPTPPADTPMPHLPTTETSGARIPGQEETLDVRVTKTEYNWDLRKPKVTIVDPGGLEIRSRILYDSSGLVKERRQPSNYNGGGAGTTKYRYYTAGEHPVEGSICGYSPALANLPCETLPADYSGGGNPLLLVTKYANYSPLDQPTTIFDSPGGDWMGRTTTIAYDAAGRQTTTKQTGEGTSIPKTETLYSVTTGRPVAQRFVCEAPEECEGFDSQAVTTTHDSLGRPISYEDADGNVSGVAYDLLGRTAITYDGKGTQTATYDEDSGLLTQMHDSAAGTFTATYNADGQMIESALPNGLVVGASYDEAGSPTHLTYEQTYCSKDCTWLEFDRESSIHGQVLRQESTIEGVLSSQDYSYDHAGRLTLAKDTEAGQCTTRAYSFDANTNRTKLITRDPGEGGACDVESEGEKQEYEYDAADRLLGEGVEYDNFGRITDLPAKYSGGGKLETTYYVNDLTRSQTQDGITNTYELDATGRQRMRTRTGGSEAGTEIYHYANGSDSPAWMDKGEGDWTRFIGGLGATAIEDGATEEVTLQLADMHGDIVATADIDLEATALLSTQQFDEYGNPKAKAELETTPKLGWLGSKLRRTELPSGVIQMGVRSYVPTMGRFISTDPIPGGSANAYDYVNQDPINAFDLGGLKPHGNACLMGVGINCTCKLRIRMWSKKRGRMGVRTTFRCNRAGGVTRAGGYTKYERRVRGTNILKGKFEGIPTPRFLNKPSIQAQCRNTDPCQNSWSSQGTFACEPGREYQIARFHQVLANLRGQGRTFSGTVKAQEHCAT